VLLEIIHNPPAVAAIVAAILALISGALGPSVQLRIGKRQVAAAQRAADGVAAALGRLLRLGIVALLDRNPLANSMLTNEVRW